VRTEVVLVVRAAARGMGWMCRRVRGWSGRL